MLTVIINNNIYYYSTLILKITADFENFLKKIFVITFLLHIGDSRKVKILASDFHCLRLQHGVLFH